MVRSANLLGVVINFFGFGSPCHYLFAFMHFLNSCHGREIWTIHDLVEMRIAMHVCSAQRPYEQSSLVRYGMGFIQLLNSWGRRCIRLHFTE